MQCKGINKNGKQCHRIVKHGKCWQHAMVKSPIVKSPIVKSPKIIIYSISSCPYCIKAKQLLKDNAMPYTEIIVTNAIKQQLIKKTGVTTVPQIFINGKFIGGYSDLSKMLNR